MSRNMVDAAARRETLSAGPGAGKWLQNPEQAAVEQAGREVEEGLRDGGAELRRKLRDKLRAQAEAAVERLGRLMTPEGRWTRSKNGVALNASKTVLRLLKEAERHVEDDRLAAVEAALRAEGKLPPLPDTDTKPPAQPAQGADGADKGKT